MRRVRRGVQGSKGRKRGLKGLARPAAAGPPVPGAHPNQTVQVTRERKSEESTVSTTQKGRPL
jgi:hypothetical protein